MLLTKKEIKLNILYILSLLAFIVSFYMNIIKNSNIFIACTITFLILLFINLVYYNTFSAMNKKVFITIYYIFLTWMVCNKIYYLFFSEYIIFDRASTAGDAGILINSILGVGMSFNLAVFIISLLVNIMTFKHAKFRMKHLKFPSLILMIILIATSIGIHTYEYEVITYLFYTPFNNDAKISEDKPITTEVTNMFDGIMNRTHEVNEYTGIAKGRNLILVQCESFQDVMINRKYGDYTITPYIDELIKTDTLYFDNCFAQTGWGNTSDSEFIVTNSFYPMPMESVYNRYPSNYYYGLPKILKKNNYNNAAYHGYLSEMWNRNVFYPNAGIEKYYSFDDYPTDQYIGFGIADKEFFDKTSKYIKTERTEAGENLEFSFIITLSSHTPFNTSSTMSDIKLNLSDDGTMFGRYVININYLDSAIKELISYLKRDGLYDNSIIVFYGDHQGLNLTIPENYKTMTNFLGKPYSYDDMLNIPFIIHIPGLGKAETISTTCGQMDILPTILNMLGIENDTIYFGDDLMNLEETSDRVIGGSTLMPRGSYIDKDYIFLMSNNSIYEDAMIYSRETGDLVDALSRNEFYEKSMALEKDIKLSNTITSKNILKALLDGNNIILNNVNPQTFVYNINSDDDSYNYEDRLNDAINAGYNLLNVKVYNYDNDFYVSNRFNVYNEMTLAEFLKLAKNYPNTYVILSGISDFMVPLFRELSKNYPEESAIVIPEIYLFDDYQNIKIFNMNTPILSLEKMSYSNEDAISFITNNELFAIKTTTNLYNGELMKKISSIKEIFTYISNVNDKSIIKYYSNSGIKGFYTDELSFANQNKKN